MTRPRVRILVVDDDAADRMVRCRDLAAAAEGEFEVVESGTAHEALRKAGSEHFDCILLEYCTLGSEWWKLLLALVGLVKDEDGTPVVVLTGRDGAALALGPAHRGDGRHMREHGPQQRLQALPAAIARLLREHRTPKGKRRARAMFRPLVEQVQAITYVRDLAGSGGMRYVSPQVKALGFSVDDWLAGPSGFLDAVHREDRPRVAITIARSVANGTGLRLEYRLVGMDGSEHWFRDEAEVICDAAGRKLFLQGILVDITQSKLTEEALRDSREALRRLSAHQEEIKESERKRIAHEIHDELGGLLTSIQAHIEVSIERSRLAGAQADGLLVEASRLIGEATQAVRRIINDLRPSVLDQLGVWDAIEWYAHQVETRFGLVCDCVIAPSALAADVDPERSIMLFRIVQESLTNIVRHAEASFVAVRAAAKDGVLSVEIRDDGKGFPAGQARDGRSWGIQGMQERSRHFGGQLTVSSAAGKGTCVALRLPLESSDGR